jgi:small neutral amino acid transporter SnatA (MarC family)
MFATLLVISILLVGPEGAAIFGLLIFEEKKIEGRVRRLALAVVTAAIAAVASLALALFGSTALEHMGIALGAVGILGGIVSVKTGLEPLKIDLLKPFRREDDKEKKRTEIVTRRSVWLITPTAGGGLLAQSAQVEVITEVEEANEEEKNENESAPEPHGWLRRLVNDLAKVFVPIVFPTSVGPAYIAWLVNPTAAGKPLHAPLALLVTAILITMLVTLSAMTVAVLIGEKMPDWLGNFLARIGGIIFVLFGVGTFFGGLNMLT